jgi:neuronal growth regulator 1
MKSLRVGCVLFIATVSLCYAQRSPSITYISEDQIVDVGGTVELACSVQYGTEYSVIWLKSGKNRKDNIFLSTGTSLVVKESRFALLYDGASATYIVLIKDLQETDAGVYQCEVVLSVNNKITAETRLSVRQPPIISDNSTSGIIANEGQQIQMECYATGTLNRHFILNNFQLNFAFTGFPPPKIVWRRENNALLPTGKI